jgi:hypothetical protein
MGAGYGTSYTPAPERASSISRGGSGSSNDAWGYYLAAFFLAAIGFVSLNDFRYALAAQTRWTEASGRVTGNKVIVHHGRRSTSYNTYISYAYDTGSGEYAAGSVEVYKYRLFFTESGAWDDLRDNFAEGKSIDVYYNPNDPSQSSLGLAGSPGPLVPVVFFLLAFGAAYAGRQQ